VGPQRHIQITSRDLGVVRIPALLH
jgi:hypothetical protein